MEIYPSGGIYNDSYILMALYLLSNKDMYGYEINKSIEAMNADRQYTSDFYSILGRLEDQRILISYSVVSDRNQVRKYYHLTSHGYDYFEFALKEYMSSFRETAGFLGVQHDGSMAKG